MGLEGRGEQLESVRVMLLPSETQSPSNPSVLQVGVLKKLVSVVHEYARTGVLK